jgi:hypothetical protein
MLRYRGRLRLSARDMRRWVRITGFEPIGVRCVDDLANYVRVCKAHFWGSSDDTKFIHWLIDEEFLRCIGAEAESTSPPPGDTTKIGRPRHRRGSGRLVALDGGRAKLEREWLKLVVLGQDDSPRAQQLAQMLGSDRAAALRLVRTSDAGTDAAEPNHGTNPSQE